MCASFLFRSVFLPFFAESTVEQNISVVLNGEESELKFLISQKGSKVSADGRVGGGDSLFVFAIENRFEPFLPKQFVLCRLTGGIRESRCIRIGLFGSG